MDYRKQHKRFIFNTLLESEKKKEDRFIYKITLNLSVKKEIGGFEAMVNDLLNDIRALTRVTVVQSLESFVEKDNKYMSIKIKFNVKNLKHEGYLDIADFVEQFLLPTITKLEAKPKILNVSNVTHV